MADRLHVGTRKGLFELARRPRLGHRRDPLPGRPRVGGAGVRGRLAAGGARSRPFRGQALAPRSRRHVERTGRAGLPTQARGRRRRSAPLDARAHLVAAAGRGAGPHLGRHHAVGLFRSDDGGATWTLNEPLLRMPDRKRWMGVAGGEQPGISAVLVDPRDPDRLRLGVRPPASGRPRTVAGPGASSTRACTTSTCRPGRRATRSPRTSTRSPTAPPGRTSSGASTTTASSGPRMAAPTGAR